MPEFIRTQCPNCYTQYKVDVDKLASGKNKSRCTNCQTPFIIMENLAANSNKVKTNPKPDEASSKNNHDAMHEQNLEGTENLQVAFESSIRQEQSEKKHPVQQVESDDDFLIHDDMSIDDDDSEAIEDDIEIDFDADFGDEWQASGYDQTSGFSTDNSTIFSDNENSESVTDDAWIQSLLEEEEEEVDTHVDDIETFTAPVTNSNLNSLLDDLGVQSVEPVVPEVEDSSKLMANRIQKNKKTVYSKAKPSSNISIMTQFFWLLGCMALLLLLLAQYTVFNLDALIKDPTQQARLQKFCSLVNCALPEANVADISISNQKYRSSKFGSNATDIMAVMSNTGSNDQLFPNIKISVFSGKKLIGELVAEPEEYQVTPQRILGKSQVNVFMLTVKVEPESVTHIKITPFY